MDDSSRILAGEARHLTNHGDLEFQTAICVMQIKCGQNIDLFRQASQPFRGTNRFIMSALFSSHKLPDYALKHAPSQAQCGDRPALGLR
ncbi:hypothetical protein [Noviherbaspirillum agri]